MSARELITENLDLWTGAVTQRRSAGRGSNGKIELTGINKLRELILELAVRGKLVEQDPCDEPASVLLERIADEKARLVKEGKIKKPKKLPEITEEEPIDLPKGWQVTYIGEFITLTSGQHLKGEEYSETPDQYSIPYLTGPAEFGRINPTPTRYTKERRALARPGDILITCKGSGVGKLNWADEEIAISRQLMAASSIIVDKRYTFFILDSLHESIREKIVGIAIPGISREDINHAITWLPPLSEQHRIVEKVDELMALCDRLEQQVGDQLEAHELLVDTLLDALTRSTDAAEVAEGWARIAEHFDTLFTTESSIDKLEQAILQLAVMGRLVDQDPDDEPASVLLERIDEEKARLVKEGGGRKQKPLPEIDHDEYPFEIPSGWAMSRMDDITNIQSGIAKGKKLSGKKATWVPYLRVANVQRGGIDLSEVKEIEMACDEVEKYTVNKRDLLITEGGDWDKVGRTAIWNADIEPMTHQNHVFRACLILGEQNEHWIEKFLNSGFAREYFANSSKQITNLASINKTQLRSCIVPIPPLEEQQRIIDKADELIALCDRLKARLDEAGETRTHLAEAVVEQAVS